MVYVLADAPHFLQVSFEILRESGREGEREREREEGERGREREEGRSERERGGSVEGRGIMFEDRSQFHFDAYLDNTITNL